MSHYIVKTGHDRGYIEAERAYSGAILTGGYEFDGYVVYAQGTRFQPFEVTPVDDLQASADFVTITGGRYNAVH